MARTAVALRELIREIPDFPRPGIGFKDITPLMADADGAGRGGAAAGRATRGRWSVDCVVAAEARGFLLGAGAGAASSARASRSRASPASCRTRR